MTAMCTCECSPPEFGGNLPDRGCPHHGDPARLALVVTHTRTSTHGYGPDYCAECSEAISDWVPWEGHRPASPPQQENEMNTPVTATATDLATAARCMAVLLSNMDHPPSNDTPPLPMPFNAEVSRHGGIVLSFRDGDAFTAWCDRLTATPEDPRLWVPGEVHHNARVVYEGQPLRLSWVEFR